MWNHVKKRTIKTNKPLLKQSDPARKNPTFPKPNSQYCIVSLNHLSLSETKRGGQVGSVFNKCDSEPYDAVVAICNWDLDPCWTGEVFNRLYFSKFTKCYIFGNIQMATVFVWKLIKINEMIYIMMSWMWVEITIKNTVTATV